jgi:NitT/TauT family transport system substrate-binding protein
MITAAALFGCADPHQERMHEVRVALSIDGITWLPVRLAQSLGYARQEGIRLSISDFTALSKTTEALLGQSVDVSAGGLTLAIQVAAEGRDVRCFLMLQERPILSLVVAPAMNGKIRSIHDLKGRHIGVPAPGSFPHQFVNFLLASQGLTPQDVSTVSVGTSAASIAALEHGSADAGILVGAAIPVFERKHPAALILADTRTPEGAQKSLGEAVFPATALMAQDQWLSANPRVAQGMARAVKKAMQWMISHSAEEIRAQIPEDLRMMDVEADLEAIRVAQRNLSRNGVTPMGAPESARKFVAVSNERVRTAHIDLAKVYTNEFAVDK